jgi:hypothetical protein
MTDAWCPACKGICLHPPDYLSPFIEDRIGANTFLPHRFEVEDWREYSEYLMEQVCAEHWFEGIEH